MRKKKKNTYEDRRQREWGIKGNGNWFKGIFARRFQLSRKKTIQQGTVTLILVDQKTRFTGSETGN